MESLHSRVRAVWIVRAVVVACVLAVAVAAAERWLVDTLPAAALVAVGLVAAGVGIGHALVLYSRWGFELQDDALYLERGVVTFVETSVPFVRVQHVDTEFGPVERALGLSSVVVYTAGSRNADVTIPGLRPERARRLQDTLRDLAVESEGEDAV
ncbi:PH domain-containing protein [Saliphagus infecundisoli]|uniref:PH domain-containing protein n=1 Tax=Saliphagus infecundisoli TaxID=1849069 RepID=A0ABD5Q9W1_9EURY|nr:PH domain-containing protein [Saliphagus infecundisoli]